RGSPCHSTVSIAAIRIYELSFLTGLGLSSVVYDVLNASAAFEAIDVTGYDSSTHVGV
ncbi:hypothetical protein EV363DRAFT_1210060, partial [Boletus edulis]